MRASVATYNKRNDRYFFEKLSRKYDKQEIIEYFVSSFIKASDPSKLWIGDLKEDGDNNYREWKAKVQSLHYRFKEEIKRLIEGRHLYECLKFESSKHPDIIRAYIKNDLSLETLFILDDIFHFMTDVDYDPVIKITNFKIKKYRPFFEYDKKYFIEMVRTLYDSR